MASRPPDHLIPALNALRRGDAVTARREAERELTRRPGDALLSHLAGVASCQSGDLEAGIVHFEKALVADPRNGAIRVLLARALADTHNHERAVSVTEGADEPELLEIGAASAAALGRHDLHAAALARLISLRADDPALRRAYGHALALAGQPQQAAEALDDALSFDPSSIDTRIELAQLLCDLGEAQGGLAAFDDGLEMAPDNVLLLLGRARALTMLRNFEDAEAVYERLLAVAPANLEALREYGLLLERTGRIDDIPALVARGGAAGLSDSDLGLLNAFTAFREKDFDRARSLAEAAMAIDPVRVQRLIAKIEEARGDMPAAFRAAQAMNDAAPDHDHWRERGTWARAEIRRLAGATTESWGQRFPHDAPGERPAPSFIVGFPRSGTTLLDTFLMGHPAVTVLEEEPMLEAAKAVVGDLAALPQVSASVIAEARAAYFASLDERIDPRSGRLVVDKMPFNMLGAALIHRLFPGASIIFAQRHPCDVVLSGFMQSFRLNDGMASFLDLGDAADLYDASMDLWTRTRATLPVRVHDLVYEELVENTEGALRPLIDFIGLEWRGELLDHQSTAVKRGTIITPSYDQVTQPINRRAMGRWRQLATEMAPVLPVLLPWARRLGYED